MPLTKKQIRDHMQESGFIEDSYGSWYKKYETGEEYRLVFKARVFHIQKKMIVGGETKFVRIKSGNYNQAKIQDGKFINLKT